MRFEVTFHTTYTDEGKRIGKPSDTFIVPEGTIRHEAAVRTEPPENLEYRERNDAEINPDYIGTETWEYDVEDGRDEDFREILRHSPYVVEYTELPEAA